MKVFLHEISDEPKDLHFTQADAWVLEAVTGLDEKQPSHLPAFSPTKPVPRTIDVELSLTKVDEVVIINGDVQAQLRLLCSRCANPYLAALHPMFQMMYTRDPVLAGVSVGPGDAAHPEIGHARHAHDEDERDLDIALLKTDYIDLAELLTEQLQLNLPLQPLCSGTCKGICSNCGADLNVGRCACKKILGTGPFAALKDFKTKASS